MPPDDAFGWWKQMYERAKPEDLPWYSPFPDRDFLIALRQQFPKPGKALDLGCGPGTHAVALAELGWSVTALDVAPGAISMASGFAKKAGVSIDFVNADALGFKPEAGAYDLVHDRGFLHTIDSTAWPRWTKLVTKALKKGGLVMAKEFYYNTARTYGPRGLKPSELELIFTHGLKVKLVKQGSFFGNDSSPEAFLVIAERS